ncbi:MAG: DsbA family protein [Chloroflexota bacterium]|nr:DsbA family protein [Chloroflexota bacterium]
MTVGADQTQTLRFLFDPACPWAWRTSQWVRNARKERPIQVEWELFSLEYANREGGNEGYLERARRNRVALRLLHLAREHNGSDGIDRLYEALGKARHERGQVLHDPQVLSAALREAGLDEAMLDAATQQTDLDETLEDGYQAAEETGAFGVPTLYFGKEKTPYFGPVIDPVPDNEEAAKLWDNLSGLAEQPYFFELKRPRG